MNLIYEKVEYLKGPAISFSGLPGTDLSRKRWAVPRCARFEAWALDHSTSSDEGGTSSALVVRTEQESVALYRAYRAVYGEQYYKFYPHDPDAALAHILKYGKSMRRKHRTYRRLYLALIKARLGIGDAP